MATIRKHPLWKKGLLLFFGLSVALGVIEIALRVLEPKSTAQIMTSSTLPSGHLYIHLIPNSSGPILGRTVTINSAGYRGRLVPETNTPGVVRIGVFGDSHTFGWGAGDDASYPAVMEKVLNAGGARRYEVLNFGVGGMDLVQWLHHARLYTARFHLDVVLLTYHQWDLIEDMSGDVIVKAGLTNPEQDSLGRNGLRKLRDVLCRFSALARFIAPRLSQLTRRGGEAEGTFLTESELAAIRQNSPIWQQRSKEVLDFVAEARRDGRTVGMVLFPQMLDFEHHPAVQLHESLESWCATNGLPCVNLLPAFRGQRAGDLLASRLDQHPNERGYEIAGRYAAAWVEKLTVSSTVPKP